MSNKSITYLSRIQQELNQITDLEDLLIEEDDGEPGNVSDAREIAVNAIDHQLENLEDVKKELLKLRERIKKEPYKTIKSEV